MKTGYVFIKTSIIGMLLSLLVIGCAGAPQSEVPATPKEPVVISDLAPVSPQPAESEMTPGLGVYFFKNYTSKSLTSLTQGYAGKGKSGAPIAQINHQFPKGENLYDSGKKNSLGVRMKGMIHFPEPGKYTLRALVNDAVRVYVGEQMVIDDPKFGSDRDTAPAELTITQPGWYPLMVEYFQRKGSATLKLSWRTDAAGAFEIVPEKAFAHTGKEFDAKGM